MMGLKTVIGMGEGHFVLFREFDSFDACELKGQNRIQPFGSTYVKEFNHRVMGLIFINYQCGPTKKTNKKTSPVPEIFEFPSVLLSVNTGVLEYDLRRDTNLSVNTFGFSMVEWVENNWYSACKLLFDAQWHLELSKGKN